MYGNIYYLQKLCMEKQSVNGFSVVITLFVQVTQLVQIPEMTKQRYLRKMSADHLYWGFQELNSTFNNKSCLCFLFMVFTIHRSWKLWCRGTEWSQPEQHTIIHFFLSPLFRTKIKMVQENRITPQGFSFFLIFSSFSLTFEMKWCNVWLWFLMFVLNPNASKISMKI